MTSISVSGDTQVKHRLGGDIDTSLQTKFVKSPSYQQNIIIDKYDY